MSLLLGTRSNLNPGQAVYSERIEIPNSSIEGDFLEIDIGHLYINDVPSGRSGTVSAGDIIQIRLNSPNDYGQSAISYVRQSGQLVGYFAAITQNSLDYTYDTRYNSLFSFETPNDANYIPSCPERLVGLSTSGVELGSYALTSTPVKTQCRNAAVVLDFQRDKVTVFDTDTKSVFKILRDGQGPCSEISLYDADQLKVGQVIAYHKSGTIVIYDSTFSQSAEYSLPGVEHLAYHGTYLYASVRGQTNLVRYTINPITLTLTAQTAIPFLEKATYLFGTANGVFACTNSGIVTVADSIVVTLPEPVRSGYVDYLQNVVYLTHGFSKRISVVDLNTNNINTITVQDAIFLDSIVAQPDGRIYACDIEAKKVFVRAISNADWELTYPAYGILLADQIYLGDIYSDIPSKITTESLLYSVDDVMFTDEDGILLGTTNETGALELLTSNRPVNVKLFPPNDYAVLLKNGQPTANETDVSAGDILSIRYNYDWDLPNPIFMGIIVNQTVYEIEAYADDLQIVPNDFIFQSQHGVPFSTPRTSNVITVAGLDRLVSITSPNADILINGNVVTQPYLLKNGDDLSLRVISGPTYCEDVVGLLHLEDRFTAPFLVSTMPEPRAEGLPPITVPAILFADTFDCLLGREVISSKFKALYGHDPIELTIPDLYDATFVYNDVDVGRTVTYHSANTLQIKLRTTYNYGTPHHVVIHSCRGVFEWTAWTVGDSTPDAFDFGTIVGLSIKERAQSNIVTVSGISPDTAIVLKFPHGVLPIINGQPIPLAEADLDYRGVLLRDYRYATRMSPGDTIQLSGYARPIHGTEQNIPVFIGSRRGYWTLGTFQILNSEFTDRVQLASNAATLEFDYTSNEVQFTSLLQAEVTTSNQPVVTSETTQAITASVETNTVEYLVGVETLSDSITDTPSLQYESLQNSLYAAESNSGIEIQSNGNYILFDSIPNETFVAGNQSLADNERVPELAKSSDFITGTSFTGTITHNLSSQHFIGDAIYTNETSVFNDASFLGSEFFQHNFYEGELDVVIPVDAVVFHNNVYLIDAQPSEIVSDVIVDYVPEYMKFQEVFNYSGSIEVEAQYDFQQNFWVTTSLEDQIVVPNPDPVQYNPEYVHDTVHPVNYTDPHYVPQETAAEVYVDPDYETVKQNPYVYVDGDYVAAAGHTPVYVEIDTEYHSANLIASDSFSDVSIEPASDLLESERGEYIASAPSTRYIINSNMFDPTDHSMYAVINVPDVTLEPVNDFTRTPQPNTTHPGYFDNHAQAVADAYRWGMVNGTFYTLRVPEKGWCWTEVVECANLCNPNDCPPEGYIQGG